MPLKRCNKGAHKHVELWTIKNISSYLTSTKDIYLHYQFSAGFEGKDEWQLSLQIYRNAFDGTWIIGKFGAINKVDINHHAFVNVYSRYGNSKVYNSSGVEIFRTDNTDMPNRVFDIINFESINDLENYDNVREIHKEILKILLPNDTLDLRIELTTYADNEPMFPLTSRINLYPLMPREDVSDQVLELYDSRNMSGDVVINVQNKKFRVHRNVLKQYCPELHKLIDDKDNISLDSFDISADIFEMMIEYIYLKNIDDLDDNAEKLLEAAHYFRLYTLKYLCEKSLAENYVGYDNFIEAYRFASHCNADQLLWYIFYFLRGLSFVYSRRWSTEKPPNFRELKDRYFLLISNPKTFGWSY